VAGRSRIHHDGRELTSVVREFTDPGRMAAEAAAQGIDHLLLSPWVRLLPFEHPLAEARDICKVQNDALAALVAADPDRFSALGVLPLQDPVTAARDLRTLIADGLAGVELTPGIAGRYLGDDAFEPFWEAAQDTGAVLFVHPATRGLALPVFGDYYLWNSVANPVETTIAAAHLVMAGVLERHPALKIVLAHGGGALWAVRGAAPARPRAGPRRPGPVARDPGRVAGPAVPRHRDPRPGAAAPAHRGRGSRPRPAGLGPAVRHGQRRPGR
jgi:aminocarboxymuconate-semialdehyde decarboxylase